MSAIGANRWVQAGSAALLLLVLLLLFRGCGREHRTTEEVLRVAGGDPVPRGLAVDLGVEGDTEADTVKTLVAEVKNLRDEADALRDSNVGLRKDNAELRKMELWKEKHCKLCPYCKAVVEKLCPSRELGRELASRKLVER